MYEYKQEEVAWQRLKDLQREMENSRRTADGLRRGFATLRLLVQRAWLLAGLATRRPPRRRPDAVVQATEIAAGAREAA